MRNLIFGLIGSILFIFVVWVAIAYDKYGADIINHHINLEAMFTRFKNSWITYNVYDDIKGINTLSDFFGNEISLVGNLMKAIEGLTGISFSTDNDFFNFIINVIKALIEPITGGAYILALIGYGTYSITRILITCFAIIGECMAFLFNPMFI